MLRDIAHDDWHATAEDLGWIAIEASRLEFALVMFFHELMGATGPRAEWMGQSWGSIRKKCMRELQERTQAALNEGGDVELWERAQQAIENATRLVERRNDALHANWGPVWVGQSHQSWLYKRGGVPRIQDWTRETFLTLQRELDDATTEFDGLIRALPR